MLDLDQWQFCYAEKFCFGARQLHENGLAQGNGGLSLLL
jgi:hypothetical protein